MPCESLVSSVCCFDDPEVSEIVFWCLLALDDVAVRRNKILSTLKKYKTEHYRISANTRRQHVACWAYVAIADHFYLHKIDLWRLKFKKPYKIETIMLCSYTDFAW